MVRRSVLFAVVAPAGTKKIAAAVDETVARYGLPGIAVGVVVDGEVRQVELRGEAVAGGGQAIGRDTLFKVASNTKAMTAALLARGRSMPACWPGTTRW